MWKPETKEENVTMHSERIMRALRIFLTVMWLAASGTQAANIVDKLTVTDGTDAGTCTLTIGGNYNIVDHKELVVDEPPKIVIDINGATSRLKATIPATSALVKRVRTSQFSPRPPKVRIVLDLHKKVRYVVQPGKTLVMVLTSAEYKPAEAAAAMTDTTPRADSGGATAVPDTAAAAAAAGTDTVTQPAAASLPGTLLAYRKHPLFLPVAGGVVGLLVVLVVLMAILKQRKKKQEEEEFEQMLRKDAEVRGTRRPIPTGDPEEGQQAALGELAKGLAEVKQQAATIRAAGGFEIEVVDAAAEEPQAAPEKEPEKKIDSDELQKKFSGMTKDPLPNLDEQIQDLLGGAKPKHEAAFDLDATLDELKLKMQEDRPAPPPSPFAPVPPPAEPLSQAPEISIDLPEPEPQAAPPLPVAEPIPAPGPAVEMAGDPTAQEDAALVNKMQDLQRGVAGFKAVVTAREQRIAELVALDKRIQADLQDIQRRLNSSLAKLEALESSVGAAEQQVPAEPAMPRRALRIDKSVSPPKIDVVVDEEAAPPRPAPAPAANEPPKFKKVFELADQGMSVTEIAQQLGIGKGQVDLFLKLREKGKMS
jgi:hypothetical protein